MDGFHRLVFTARQKFARMGTADLTVRIATEHARDLDHPGLIAHHHGVSRGHRTDGALAYDHMMVGARCDLCEV